MTKLIEGLQEHDLDDLVLPLVSIDEYEPKTGDDKDVIVVGWFVNDEKPARDLERFVEKGDYDVLDTETSPAPNPEGYYLVFAEFLRNDRFPDNLLSLLNSMANLTNIKQWQFKPLHDDEIYDLDVDNIREHIELDPEKIGSAEKGEDELVDKEEAAETEHKEMSESIEKQINEMTGYRPGHAIPNPAKVGQHANDPAYGDWSYTIVNPQGEEEVVDDSQDSASQAKSAMREYVKMMNHGDTEGNSELAMQTGMGHGLQAYNDIIGSPMGEAAILTFLKPSLANNVRLQNNKLIIERLGQKQTVTVVGFGNADELYEKFGFANLPLRLDEDARAEVNKLAFYLGHNFAIDAFDKYIAISSINDTMLLINR